MNILDRAIRAISPERAVSREIAKAKLNVIGDLSANAGSPSNLPSVETRWRGASRMLRTMANWLPRLGSASADLPSAERRTLVARSYDAYRGHMLARAAIVRARTNIVGTGLIAHPAVDADVLGISPDEAERLNLLIGRKFRSFAENPLECDIEATLDFYGQQGLAQIGAMLSGDCFATTPFIERPGCMWGLKVQLVEGARVSNPNGILNTVTLTDGIETDTAGSPIVYHVQRRHPGDTVFSVDQLIWDSIPVFGENTGRRRTLHIWNDKDRIGLMRGAPFLAPILEPLQTLEQYGRAELIAAVISAMFTVFITKDEDKVDNDGNPLPALGDGTQPSTLYGSQVPPVTPGPSIGMGNGAVVDLAPGEKTEFANPTRPNANYDPFFTSIVKQIGAALEIPVDELLLKYDSSYSAARAAMLQAWRFYTTRRWSLVQQFCMPIYQLWFDEAVARGVIPVVGYTNPERRQAYTQCLWVGPARGSMDEQKEAGAAAARIDAGLSNETIEVAAMIGEDRATVYAQRLREINQRKKDGTWALRPTETVRVSPVEDPNANPDPPSPPIEEDA